MKKVKKGLIMAKIGNDKEIIPTLQAEFAFIKNN